MEKQRICKICNRRFSNGKAMGGHMRSHLAKLPIPPKPHQQLLNNNNNNNSTESTPTTQSPSSSSYSLNDLHQYPRKNPNKPSNYMSLNREVVSQDSAIHDKESDDQTESQPKNLTRRRSKRRRKEVAKVANKPPFEAEQQQVSISLYETFSEEEVAMCLIMLSKDKWNKKEDDVEDDVKLVLDDDEDEQEEEESEEEDQEEDMILLSRSRSRSRTPAQNQSKFKFKCETCKKVFRSYQALGGHRASHKKIIIKTQIFDGGEFPKEGNNGGANGSTANYVIEHKTFECPFCLKVFESGQALGGHKKVHFSNLSNNARNIVSAKFRDNLVIDLNLPAPEEDEDVVTHETVSDY